MKPELHFIVVDHPESSGLFEKCRQIRVEVFVNEQGFALGDEFDDLDRQSIHLLFSLDDRPGDYIGTLRYIPQKQKVGRLALLATHRGRGLGRRMMESLERFLVDKYSSTEALLKKPDGGPFSINSCPTTRSDDVGLSQEPYSSRSIILLKLHSQIYIMPFYEKLGYEAVGDRFDEDGAPHQLMVKRIEIRKDC